MTTTAPALRHLTLVPSDHRTERPVEKVQCKRCGIDRQVNHSRAVSPVCRDCKSVLTRDEYAKWAA